MPDDEPDRGGPEPQPFHTGLATPSVMASRSRTVGLPAILVLGAVLLTPACGSPDPDRLPGPRLVEEVETEVVALVGIDRTGFDPAEVTLEVGQALELVNDEEDALRVRGRSDDEPQFDTGRMRPGESTIIAFRETGEVTFTVSDAADESLRVTVLDAR